MSLDPLTGPARGAGNGSALRAAAGVWRGRVTRVVDGYPYVELPRLAAGYEYGPLEALVSVSSVAVGDRVLVAFVEGRADDPVIVGRFGGAGGGAGAAADDGLLWVLAEG